LITFKFQLKLAAKLKLPVVRHSCGEHSFIPILNTLKQHLKEKHHIHWHCNNSLTNLDFISNCLNQSNNSYIVLNGSGILQQDMELQKSFHKWLSNPPNIINKIILETDFSLFKTIYISTAAIQRYKWHYLHSAIYC